MLSFFLLYENISSERNNQVDKKLHIIQIFLWKFLRKTPSTLEIIPVLISLKQSFHRVFQNSLKLVDILQFKHSSRIQKAKRPILGL